MRLSFESIKFRNFLSYGNKWQEVSFKEGITLITGRDLDTGRSNGSGKSSLLESIPVGLFGKGSRPVIKADFVNWKNKKNCEIINTFLINDTEYSILRAIKPDKLEIYKNGKLIDDIAHDKRILQKEIEEDILGIDYKTFMNIVYSNLNNLDTILLMKKPEKRKFLEKIFNLSYFSIMIDKINKRISKIEEKIHEHDSIISGNNRSISDIRTQSRDIKEKIENTDDSSLKLKDLEERYDKITEDIDIEELKEKIREIDNEILKISSEHSFLQLKMDKVILRQRYINNTILRKIKDKIKNEDDLKEKMLELEEVKDQISKIITLEDSEITHWESELKEEKEKRDQLTERKNRINEDIVRHESKLSPEIEQELLEGKTKCPTCKSVIDSEEIIKKEKERVEKIQKELENLKRNRSYVVEEIKSHESSIKDIERMLKENSDKVLEKSRLETKLGKIDGIKEKIDDIEESKKKKVRFERALSKLKQFSDRLKEHEANILENESNLRKKSEPMKKVIERVDRLETEINDLYYKIEQENKYKDEMKSILKGNDNRIQELNKEIKESEKKIENLEILKDHLTALKSICGDENIKQYAISTRIPYVMKRMNHYLNTSGFGFYVVLDKWMEHEIKGPGITGKSLKSFSGGESKSVDLSLRFALMDSLKVSSGIWPDMIIADELLDSSIDAVGLNNIMEILNTKQREDKMKIPLVSHRDEIEDIDIENKIEIVKEKGFSRIV